MAKRSRKRRPEGATLTQTAPPPAAAPPEDAVGPDGKPLSKAERRNIELRANLDPLADGERPGAVTVGAIAALLLGLANIVLLLAGYQVQSKNSGPIGAILFAVIMFAAAWGMWNVRYWAVLGFEALLAIVVVVAALSLMVASKWQGVVLCLVVIGLGGTLFWKLIRAMARIQMPHYER